MERQLEQSKNLLLYFPAITVPDPLAKLAFPVLTIASLTGAMVIENEAKFRSEIRDALTFFAGMSPLLEVGSALLLAESFLVDNPELQTAARKELSERPDGPALDTETGKRMLIDQVTIQGLMCNHLKLVPLTASEYAREALIANI